MSELSREIKSSFSFEDLNYFPPLENGNINLNKFLKKIKKNFAFDEQSCLLDLILKEIATGSNIGAEATLWLNRALLFFELTFKGILDNLKEKQDVNMKIVFNTAYEGSVKKYHNWAVQKLFQVICQLSPTFPQVMSSLGLENNNSFEEKITVFNTSLHVVRCAIDSFFIANSLFCDV